MRPMRKVFCALLACVILLTVAAVPVQTKSEQAQINRHLLLAVAATENQAAAALTRLATQQVPPVLLREYTDIGNSRIQVDIRVGTRDANGTFTEVSSTRVVYTADAAQTAALKSVTDKLKNHLVTLAGQL